jgi:putative aldouronate transport system permease protein
LQTYLYQFLQKFDVLNIDFEMIEYAKYISNDTSKAAQIFVAMLPILLVYPFLQKYFAKGIVLGSVKG